MNDVSNFQHSKIKIHISRHVYLKFDIDIFASNKDLRKHNADIPTLMHCSFLYVIVFIFVICFLMCSTSSVSLKSGLYDDWTGQKHIYFAVKLLESGCVLFYSCAVKSNICSWIYGEVVIV